MNFKPKSRRVPIRSAFLLACLIGASAPAAAQDNAKSTTEKWRPKNGPYASLGADFSQRCRDFGNATIDFAEKEIAGSEQKCNIIKFTDTAPGAIRLEVSCVDTERENPA